MELHIHCILTTEKEANASAVISRLNRIVPGELLSLEKYPKGGTSAQLAMDLPPISWASTVLHCLQLAQSLGQGWTISGAIENEVDLCTNELRVSGVEWAHLWISRANSLEEL